MIAPLTSLRFFFAFMVFLSHYNGLFYEGYLGVGFFFILSGFVLSYSYKKRIADNAIAKTDFYIARFARIYPLHIATLIIWCIFTLIKHGAIPIRFLPFNLTLTQSFIPIKKVYFSFNAVSWSISDEMFFYLMFPFLIVLLHKLKSKIKIAIAILAIVVLLVLMFIIPDKYEHALFYISPFFRLADFMVGIFLFQLWTKMRNSVTYKNTKFHSLFSYKITSTLLEIGAISLLIASVYLSPLVPQVLRYSVYYWLPMSLIMVVFSQTHSSVYLYKLLSNKLLVFLGEISFGFYMIHQLVISITKYTLKSLSIDINTSLTFSIVISITILLSVISYYFYETPCNKFIKNKYQYYKYGKLKSIS